MRAKAFIPICAMLIALSTVSACEKSGKDKAAASDPSPAALIVKAAFGALKPRKSAVDPRKHLNRIAIDKSPTPVLFAGIETRKAYATLAPFGENRGIVTWVSADGITLSFKNGLLVATRGLGPDLMAADVSDAARAVRAGAGSYVRIYDYLDGEDHTIRRSYYCTVENQGRETLGLFGLNIVTRIVRENCKNPQETISNTYWLSNQNVIWQSKQWVSAGIGYVFSQHLSRQN